MDRLPIYTTHVQKKRVPHVFGVTRHSEKTLFFFTLLALCVVYFATFYIIYLIRLFIWNPLFMDEQITFCCNAPAAAMDEESESSVMVTFVTFLWYEDILDYYWANDCLNLMS